MISVCILQDHPRRQRRWTGEAEQPQDEAEGTDTCAPLDSSNNNDNDSNSKYSSTTTTTTNNNNSLSGSNNK